MLLRDASRSSLNGQPGLLLNDDCTGSNPTVADQVADLTFTTSHLRNFLSMARSNIARSSPAVAVKPKSDGPHLLRLQRALRTNHPARVPRRRTLAAGSNSECPITFSSSGHY